MRKERRKRGAIRGIRNRREGEMKIVVQKAIERNFNGISREIKKTVENMDKKIDDMKEMLIRRLAEQDETIKPIAETFNNLKWGRKVVIGFLGFLVTVGSIITLVIEIRKK